MSLARPPISSCISMCRTRPHGFSCSESRRPTLLPPSLAAAATDSVRADCAPHRFALIIAAHVSLPFDSFRVSVDATLVDDWSQDASMPTKFDQFTPQAMMGYAGRDPLVKQHLNLLQKAMAYNNFYGLRVEWWHFTTADWKKYVPFWEDPTMSQADKPAAPKKS